MKPLLFILFFICTCSISNAQPKNTIIQTVTNKPAEQLARQIVDQLMNIENNKAAETLLKLELNFPDYSLLGFMKITPLWAEAETTSDTTIRLNMLHKIIKQLKQNIKLAKSKVKKYPNSPEWQLSLGLSQAFQGLAYMRLKEWLKAYRSGRAGRDALRTLIKTHPEIEDAYFVLGFYEYYTGKVPYYLKWVTWLVDMSGSRELGLKYIHRAIKYAPTFSPEASRLLLAQTETTKDNACEKEKHAHTMAQQYPNNKQFPWLEKQFKKMCPVPSAYKQEAN